MRVLAVLIAAVMWATPAAATSFYWTCQSAASLGFGSGVTAADSALLIPVAGTSTTAPHDLWSFDSSKAGVPQNTRMEIQFPINATNAQMFCVPLWSTANTDVTKRVKWDCSGTVVVDGAVESTISGREATSVSTVTTGPSGVANAARLSIASSAPMWDGLRNQACIVSNCAGHKAIVSFSRDTTVANNVPASAELTELCVVTVVTP